jgi:hypothetical protein
MDIHGGRASCLVRSWLWSTVGVRMFSMMGPTVASLRVSTTAPRLLFPLFFSLIPEKNYAKKKERVSE